MYYLCTPHNFEGQVHANIIQIDEQFVQDLGGPWVVTNFFYGVSLRPVLVFRVIMLVVALGGCATQTYIISSDQLGHIQQDKMDTFFVGGIGQTAFIDARQVCGGMENIVKIQTRMTFFNGFLSGLTAGLYSPRQSIVYCKMQ